MKFLKEATEDWARCPNCGEEKTVDREPYMFSDLVEYPMSCKSCKFKWVRLYRFDKIGEKL